MSNPMSSSLYGQTHVLTVKKEDAAKELAGWKMHRWEVEACVAQGDELVYTLTKRGAF